MLFVVGHLDTATAPRFRDSKVHGVGGFIGIHDYLTVRVTSSAADGLDQAALVSQEALLVGVENGHQRHFRQVQALAQQVDSHQHIELAQTQIAQDVHALKRADVAVHVAGAYAAVQKVIGQVLGHLLGKRGYEHALIAIGALLRLVDDVVDLACTAAHDDLGVKQARGADDLLHLLLADLQLVIAGRCRHVDELRHALLELIEAQRTIIQTAGQPEPMLGQGDLAAAIAFVHTPDLRHRHMALVDDAQEIIREIVDERVRGLSGLTSVEMPGVILDAAAKSHGLQHLKIVVHAHLQPLGLKQLALFLELLQALAQLLLDGFDGVLHLRARRYVMGGRPNGQGLIGLQNLARDVIDLGDLLYLIAPELHAHRIVRIRREHIQVIPTHAERAAFQLVVVAIVLDVDKVVDHLVAIHLFLLVHEYGHARVIHGAADAVDAADRCHHDNVAPGKERAGCGMAQFLHLFVDGGVLLDERVRRGHVRLGLIIIVVADEIHHGVVGEELLQLACKLSGKRLVRRHDKRRALHRLDGFRHGECFARSRNAQKRLIP